MKGLYVPLQADYTDDVKILGLSMGAELLWVRGLAKCKKLMSDGQLHRGHLLSFVHPDMLANLDGYIAELVTKEAWQETEVGWKYPSWLKHNKSKAEIEFRYEQCRKAGKASARSRGQQDVERDVEHDVERDVNRDVKMSVQRNLNVPISVSVLSSGSAVEGGTGGNGQPKAEPAPDQPDDNGGAFVPDDPAYRFDPAFTGLDTLALWDRQIGKIQPAQRLLAQNALIRLHNWCRRSPRELQAWVEHVARDQDARKWWGAGKSPSTWMRTHDADSGEQLWQKIRAHWLAAGGRLEAARRPKRDLGPPPEPDAACDCRRGWREDAEGQTVTCRTCALGKFLTAGGRL